MRSLNLLSLLFLLPLPAFAAGPNCNTAHTPREKLVCSSKPLSALDESLTKALDAALSQLTPSSAALVQADQRDFFSWVDKVCPQNNPAVDVTACLTDNYNTRLKELTDDIRRVNGLQFYPRATFVFTAGKRPAHGSDESKFDPGFGWGSYAWPQIDSPDRDHAPFNEAAHKTAIKDETSSEIKDATSFESGTSAGGSLAGSFTIFALNDHLIDIDLFRETYNWGGAHPGTDRTSLLWSVDGHRLLTATDILRPDSDWQHKLIEPATAKLRAGEAGQNLWEGKELTDSVAAEIANTGQWDLSREGLTITSAQYQVTCYACGTPAVTFAWPELEPYLNPGFDPKLLPERIPAPSQEASAH